MKKIKLILALLCVSVMSWATPATYTGAGFAGAINGYSYDIDYSITYDDEHHLTFNVTLNGSFQETTGFVFEVWSSDLSTGNFKSLVHGEGNSWSVTDTKDYESMEGTALNQLRLRLASSVGGTDQLYMSDYTVGLSGSAVIVGPTSRATTPTAPANKTRAITSWYYSKSCNFIDWGGGTSSQNTRFGKKLTCNRAEGNGWLGLVGFGDLDCSGMDKLHMDIWVENDATVRATPIHYDYGKEYRHTISLIGGQWNSIDLNLNATDFISDDSQGAPDGYWDVINQFKFDLLANGLEFWIDNLYFYSERDPEFTSITISGNKICQVGQNMPLTIETLDQFGEHIDAEYTCSVSPISAGTVVGTTYTASAKGNATITVTSGLISNTLTVFNYEGSNLALNHLVSQSTEFSGYGAARALDGDNGTEWQGSPTNGTAADESSRTYDCWFTADLSGGNGDKYDVDLVTIKFEGACSDAYHIDFSADGVSWETGYNFAQVMGVNGHTDYITSFTHNSGVQYVRFWSTKASTQYGMKIFEFQVFGSEAATPTKSVSATPNNALYGTATVKQEGVDVTEVATGSEVTFSAIANDGYIFVNWSNGNTNATFTTTVDAAMNLTANFRALGNIYCNTVLHSNNGGQEHDAYVTMKRSGENEYQLIVRTTEALSNFGGTNFYKPNNVHVIDIRNQGVLSNNNHTLTVTFNADKEPYMTTPLYVVYSGNFEAHFPQLTNIEYDAECDDNVPVTSISVESSAVVAVGGTTTLTPTIAPVYASNQAVTWSSDAEGVATVNSSGVVTGVSAGTAHITATTVDGGYTAQCTVTVSEAQVYWGNGRDANYDVSIAYSIEYNSDKTLTYTIEAQHDKVGFVVRITDGEWHDASSIGDNTYTFTTTATYEVNDVVNGQIYMPFSGGAAGVNYSYTVGSVSARRYIPITVTESADNSSVLTANDGKMREVTVTRSFTAGNLYTLVLPFNVDAAQTAAKLPGQLTKLNNSYEKANGDLRINFVDASAIEAGVPYLYKPSANVTNPAFVGVTVDKDLNPTIPADGLAKYYGIYAPMDGDALHAIDNAYVLGPDQYLYAVSDLPATQTMAALRGYFVLNFPAASPGAPKRLAKVVFNSNETETTTDVTEVQTGNECIKVIVNGQLQIIRDGKTYNAFGQLVK